MENAHTKPITDEPLAAVDAVLEEKTATKEEVEAANLDKSSGGKNKTAVVTLGDFITDNEEVNFVQMPDKALKAEMSDLKKFLQPIVNMLSRVGEAITFEEMLKSYLKPPLTHLGLLIEWTAIMATIKDKDGKSKHKCTIDTGVKDYAARVFKVLQPSQEADTVSVEDIEKLMHDVLFTPTEKGTEISESHANGIYRSVCRVFEFGEKEKLVSCNVTKDINEALVPHPTKETYNVTLLSREELWQAFSFMLNMNPTYANVKNFIFIYLILVSKERTGSVIELTWRDIRGLNALNKLDNFIKPILIKYLKAQKEYLEKCEITNDARYVFVKKTAPGTNAKPTYRSTAYNWFRKFVLEENGLPMTTVDALHSLPPEAYTDIEAFIKNFNPDNDSYPIMGDIEVPDPNQMFGGGGTKRSPEEVARLKAERDKLREAYVAENLGVTVVKAVTKKPSARRKLQSMSVFERARQAAQNMQDDDDFNLD